VVKASRRIFFKWLLQFYEEKEGFFWKITGLIIYAIYKNMLDYEVMKYQKYVENIDLEQGQLELLKTILEKK